MTALRPEFPAAGPMSSAEHTSRLTWQNAPMHLNLSADEVLTTTRSVRKRLDFDRPVEREIVEECLELALQAPTGSNSQGWHWVVIEDAAKKKPLLISTRRTLRCTSTCPGVSTQKAT